MSSIPAPVIEQAISTDSLTVPVQDYQELVHQGGNATALRAWIPANTTGVSSIHRVVGQDGVLVISLNRQPERFVHTAQQLAWGGILGTSFWATDSTTATDDQLNQGCLKECCGSKAVQAIADSHRRALQAAALRKSDWTAILEDDMALVDPEHWSDRFDKAWQHVPPESKIVRLSWCVIVPSGQESMRVWSDTGDFILAKWLGFNERGPLEYHPGMCTGGYMVHRDILPDLLALFPCCSPVDGCLTGFFQNNSRGNYNGMEVMINMAMKNSREWIENKTTDDWLGQYGVMYQMRNALPSERNARMFAENLEKSLSGSRCGVSTCTDLVLNTLVQGPNANAPCGSRIDWVVANMGMGEAEACQYIGETFPDVCGACAPGGAPSVPKRACMGCP
jgi:GR25 family glycosyltransferase involved in LPS biosynthesis